MAKTDADQDQLSLRVSKQLNAELITLAADYRMTKEGLCEALLLHAIEDEHIEIAVQKGKDLADQRVRARRAAERAAAQPENEDPSVVPLQRRGK